MQPQIEWNLILHGNRSVIIHGAPLTSSGRLTLRQTSLAHHVVQMSSQGPDREPNRARVQCTRADVTIPLWARFLHGRGSATIVVGWRVAPRRTRRHRHRRSSAQAVDRPTRLNLVDTAGSSPRTHPAI